MSKETLSWLNDNVRYGFTSERGPAWWAAEDYMSNGSHFDLAVPDDVVYRLFDVRLVSGPSTSVFTDSKGERVPVNDLTRQQIIRILTDEDGNESGETLGVFKQGYKIHGYNEWINAAMRNITDSQLETACAALLRKGAVAFHQVKLPGTHEVNGFPFTPYFTGATSADGTVASTWFTGVDAAWCDNSFEMARKNAQTRVSVKHTKNSPDRLADVRDELGLVVKAGEDFAQMADEYMNVEVSAKDFQLWLDEMIPVPDNKGRGQTIALNKREAYEDMYATDPMVAPVAGTKFGLLQLDNTWRTHKQTVKGANRMERNLLKMVDGTTADDDAKALAALDKVLNRKLVFAGK